MTRTLHVEKLRGSGVSVRRARIPTRRGRPAHLPAPRGHLPDVTGYGIGSERISIGIDTLDEMLEGGLLPGSTTLVAGPSGGGKTMMGLHFLAAGVRRGEAVLLATLQENLTQVVRARSGMDFAGPGRLEVLYQSPVDVYIDEWIYQVIDTGWAGSERDAS